MKANFPQNAIVRRITALVTNADPDNVPLFEIPANCVVLGASLAVSDAFNTGATLALGKVGAATHLLAAQAVDAVGVINPNLANPLHTTAPTTFIATISDKTAVGAVEISVLFSMDTDNKL
jgi:hypothetical protein